MRRGPLEVPALRRASDKSPRSRAGRVADLVHLPRSVAHPILVRQFIEPRFQIALERELSRIQAGRELVRVARPHNRSGDRLIGQDPRNGQCHEARADLIGNGCRAIAGVVRKSLDMGSATSLGASVHNL